jgi:hypothetical protein
MEGEQKEIHEGSVLVDIRNQHWPLIISFAGLGDQFQFRNILSDFEVNTIYLRDLKHNWYLNGVPQGGETVEEIVSFLKGYIEEWKFPKVVTIGASAGGYGALLFGALLNVNSVMALSPQTFINPLRRLLFWDRRWSDRMRQIYNGSKSNKQYFDLNKVLINFGGFINIFYDEKHRLDRTHAKRIKSKNVTLFSSDKGGHTLAKHLKDSGLLKKYISDILK